MKFYIFLALFFITAICQAEINVKIYYEKIENGYNIYADNQEYCPVSIKLDFDVTNLVVNGGNGSIYIVAAKGKRQLLTTLTVSKKGKAYKFTYKSKFNYGDYSQIDYEKDFVYQLPFSDSFKVGQGYNGSASHKNQNALDFDMPIGTEILAVREGIVIKVVEKNNKNCPQEECKKFNNLIIVNHSDGTFAEYTHIKRNGSKVKVGDNIKAGEVIGYSGNVGYSTGPHLHLVVYLQRLENRETLQTKFKTGTNMEEYLVEKKFYSR